MHAAEPGQHHTEMTAAYAYYEALLSAAVHGDRAIPEREALIAEKVAEARHTFILAAESRQRHRRRRR